MKRNNIGEVTGLQHPESVALSWIIHGRPAARRS